ncbi:MAG: DUF4262 domain-containing protein [Chitinophagaceae bacterium]|jgi:hypothetical protein
MDHKKLNADIEKFGWTIIALEATEYLPSYAYTIGLWKNYRHPEIIVFGLPVGMLHTVLNEAGAMIKSSQKLESGKLYNDFFENGNTCFIPVDERNFRDYINYATELNGALAFPAFELIWTDKNLKFPWEDNFDTELKFKQPLLDRNADFKFFEERSLTVFTSKQFIGGETILKVVHDEEGEWQFLTGGEISMDDAAMVSLEQLVLKDPTINDLFDLDYGQEAERKSINDQWERRLSS